MATIAFSKFEELYTFDEPLLLKRGTGLQHPFTREKSASSVTTIAASLEPEYSDPEEPRTVPGYPLISFEDDARVQALIKISLNTKKLDWLYPYLSLVSTKASGQVFPLHYQRVKGRDIIITEDHQFHMVWHYDKYFVKPIPEFLLNRLFWEHHMVNQQGTEEYKSALGLLRSWSYLIKSQSDFDFAVEKKLLRWNILSNGEQPSYREFKKLMTFLSRFHYIQDAQVSKRYLYRELFLSRLNLWCRFTLRAGAYHRIHGQYGAQLSYIITPLLFAFAVLSVVLSAVQVELSIEQVGSVPVWESFGWTARRFSFTSLGIAATSILIVVSGAIYLALHEIIWAVKHRGVGLRDNHVVNEIGFREGF